MGRLPVLLPSEPGLDSAFYRRVSNHNDRPYKIGDETMFERN